MVIFFQVGIFYEFYSELNGDVKNTLGLKRPRERRRPVLSGFPVRLEEEYMERVLKKGIPVVIIKETDRYIGRGRIHKLGEGDLKLSGQVYDGHKRHKMNKQKQILDLIKKLIL